ncbi:hypothetical protein [Ideonella sp.]|uniref:hypothetical protein n=1 Tax=Ideonella sp. TaxID=1929293 RepID=UPI002B4754C0|nr:hypothetical protein [Ideonella sp.]HJV69175.1 hypothetical protein [Ideonella sp.]
MKTLPILCLTALLATAHAAAQPPAAAWADPTRPAGAPAADAGASAPRPARTASAAPPATAPRLQSVQTGADGSASALVDGRIVSIGDTLGGSRIAAIDAEGLTLRDAKGRSERLNLIPTAIVKLDGGSPRPLAAAAQRLTGREGQRQ